MARGYKVKKDWLIPVLQEGTAQRGGEGERKQSGRGERESGRSAGPEAGRRPDAGDRSGSRKAGNKREQQRPLLVKMARIGRGGCPEKHAARGSPRLVH